MCDVAERLENRGKEIGMAKGKEIGMAEGKEIGMATGRKIGRAEGVKMGQSKGILLTIYRHTAAGYLPLDVAVKEAAEYGIKDKDDFLAKASQAGVEIKTK